MAPSGEQNAPGVTVRTWGGSVVGTAVPVLSGRLALGATVLGRGRGDLLTFGVRDGLPDTPGAGVADVVLVAAAVGALLTAAAGVPVTAAAGARVARAGPGAVVAGGKVPPTPAADLGCSGSSSRAPRPTNPPQQSTSTPAAMPPASFQSRALPTGGCVGGGNGGGLGGGP